MNRVTSSQHGISIKLPWHAHATKHAIAISSLSTTKSTDHGFKDKAEVASVVKSAHELDAVAAALRVSS